MANHILYRAVMPAVLSAGIFGQAALACPFHGDGPGVDTSGHEIRHTLVVRVTDHMKNVTKGFVPDADPLELPEAVGFRCRIEVRDRTTTEGLPVFNVSCRDRVAVRYEQEHNCGGPNGSLTPAIWNGSAGAGMTTITLTIECI